MHIFTNQEVLYLYGMKLKVITVTCRKCDLYKISCKKGYKLFYKCWSPDLDHVSSGYKQVKFIF